MEDERARAVRPLGAERLPGSTWPRPSSATFFWLFVVSTLLVVWTEVAESDRRDDWRREEQRREVRRLDEKVDGLRQELAELRQRADAEHDQARHEHDVLLQDMRAVREDCREAMRRARATRRRP